MKGFNSTFYIILLGLALIGSIIYALERTVFIDNALHIYNTCTTNEIGVMAGRWPIAIVRLPLLIGVKLNISIGCLPYIYSISHMVLLLIIGGFLLKYNTLAFPLFIITYLGVLGHTFYWCVSEIIPAVLLASYFIAKKEDSQGQLLPSNLLKFNMVSLVITILVMFSHPQGVIPLMFITFYNFLNNKSKSHLYQLLFIIIIFLIKSILFSNWYDVMKMGVLQESLANNPFGFWESKTLTQLYEWKYDYLMPLGLCIISTFILIQSKHFLKLAFYILSIFTVGYLFLQSNPNGVSRFYAESNFYLITFMSGVVMTYERIRPIVLKSIIVSLLIGCIIKVLILSTHYSNRHDYIVKLVQEQRYEKALIPKANLNNDLLMLDWGLPFETIITSQRLGLEIKTAVSLSEEKHYSNKRNDTNVFLNGIGGAYPIYKNNLYFNISDVPYQLDSTLIIK